MKTKIFCDIADLDSIKKYNKKDIVKGSAGVRAQAMSKKGELIMDFKIEHDNNQIHVLNAPSPGATASLSIATYIIDEYVKFNELSN